LSTLVFDIGKTNKKALIFDGDLHVVHSVSKVFAETTDDDGDACEDIDAVCAWIDGLLEDIVPRFSVSRINFTTYGATLVYLDEKGQRVGCVYNYLKHIDTSFLRKLYGEFGGPQHFHAVTGSPPLGALNSGFQLAWLKATKPAYFNRTSVALHLPQYLSYRLHGKLISEFTSVGCHTAMWDFGRKDYHSWLSTFGLSPKLPECISSQQRFNAFVGGRSVQVGAGLHDSSAALVTHLEAQQGEFVLLSTGTWAIALNPFDHTPLTTYELSRDCLTFLDTSGKSVKASRLFLGYEHNVRTAELAKLYNVDQETYKLAAYDPALDPVGQPPRFLWDYLHDTVPRGIGQHGDDRNFNAAYHRLMRELVDIQLSQLDLVKPRQDMTKLVVDGGFCANTLFIEMLRKAYPKAEVVTWDGANGSALGAALIAQASS